MPKADNLSSIPGPHMMEKKSLTLPGFHKINKIKVKGGGNVSTRHRLSAVRCHTVDDTGS